MSLKRQGPLFLIAGGLQFVLDWAVFVALSASGLAPAPANLMGRISGALLGFWLNGRLTFAVNGEARLGRRRFARFALMWIILTAVSTLAVSLLASELGLTWSWIAKPVIEIALAVVSFLLSRYWIYR